MIFIDVLKLYPFREPLKTLNQFTSDWSKHSIKCL